MGHIYLDDFGIRPDLEELDYEVVLLDYSNGREDIEWAMSLVRHWVCPFGPTDVRHAINCFGRWHATRSDAANSRTFNALLSLAPGPDDIEEDPEFANPLWNGQRAVQELADREPSLNILKHQFTRSRAVANTFDGKDVWSGDTFDEAASREIQRVWSSLLLKLI